MFDLTGKVAIITGSSRGIGRASAELLAKMGAKVVVSSRKEGPCDEVVKVITAEGGQAISIPANVSQKTALENLVQKTVETWGRVDICVCNAALNPHYGPMAGMSDEVFDKILGTNVRSNFWLANLVVPHMIRRGGGSIILISSIAAIFGQKNIGVYALSKAADAQLARNLAAEWGGKNIRANSVLPGLIKTDMARVLWENPSVHDAVVRSAPLARLGEPRDIAGVVGFLASDASAYVTGQSIVADGGVCINDPFPA